VGVQRAIHIPPFGELADVRVLGDLAGEAEEAGLDGVFVWDHIARPPERKLAAADTTVALASIAQRTHRVRFGALVTPLTRRRPQKFAREMVSLDQLGDGRLVVGVGLGVNSGGELERFGESADQRVMAARLDEALDIVTALWSGVEVVHRGEHFTVDGITFTPTPVQSRIPIWVGARSPRSGPMDRAARFDGIVPDTGPFEAVAMLDEIRTRRGSLDGYDVVAKGAPGFDEEPWIEAGATWLVTEMPERSTVDDVRRAIDGVARRI
jgi:alkanesulfonate monooxygenase SsuD/methylene tetrahydromethanopterin reductase-like flavin-dependent oxidoreductase (luciferase family)